MSKVSNAFSESWKIIKADHLVKLLSFIPIFIGAGLYGVLGSWLFSSIVPKGREWIESSLSQAGWGTAAYYILVTLMTILLIFIINWTFFLVVSLISSPFSDLISARVEKRILGKNPEDAGGLKEMFRRLGRTLLNEFKKIAVIFLLSLVALAFHWTGVLAPVGIAISAILFAISFLDYSWNRHEMAFGACAKQIGGWFFTYLFSGLIFLFLLSVPVVNLFMMPFASVYFTVLFTRQRSAA